MLQNGRLCCQIAYRLLFGSLRAPSIRTFSTHHRSLVNEALTTAPRAQLDIKSIRLDPQKHAQNCTDRKYDSLASIPNAIGEKHAIWLQKEREVDQDRRAVKALESQIRDADPERKSDLIKRVAHMKKTLDGIEPRQRLIEKEIESLAVQLPNLMSAETPIGPEPRVLQAFDDSHAPASAESSDRRDHVRIGTELGLLDFGAAGRSSGWGFYYLLNDGERLEHALVQYARNVAQRRGYMPCSPPTMVYSAIGAACGFRPRDKNGERQVFAIDQGHEDGEHTPPKHSLAGTAEIPFAAMRSNTVLDPEDLPQRLVGSSRCFRAEAGARGREARGLYRVHEFTKVEMFAWTLPGREEEMFEDMIAIQKEILGDLNLPYRILEINSHDLGASATRKIDMEVYFPSRAGINDGWGEVTSTSICTDYQTRRLNTRVRAAGRSGSSTTFPSTVNGTALAVPRVLAAVLENGWRQGDQVAIPEVLWPYMGGQKVIQRSSAHE